MRGAVNAWFVSNNQVTAKTASISAQSNAPFLVISNEAITENTTKTEETYYLVNDANVKLFPVQMVAATDDASAFTWESAYASLSTASTEKASTRFEVQNSDLTKYYLKETFHIGTNGTTQGQFKNLRVSGVSVTQSDVTSAEVTAEGELKNALRIMVVCEQEVAIYDYTGALVTKYQNTEDASALTTIAGLTPAEARTANGTSTTAAYLTSATAPFPETSGTISDKTVDVYLYYDGAVANIRTDKIDMLGNVKATLTFTADDYAAPTGA